MVLAAKILESLNTAKNLAKDNSKTIDYKKMSAHYSFF